MKKNLKSYDIYQKEHIKENMNSPVFDESDENLKDIIENEENIEDNVIGLGTEEEKKINNEPIIAHIEVMTEIEIPKEELPISEPANCDLFDPAKNPIQNDKLFSVVKIMTQNGEKIGMCYTEEVGEYGKAIHNDLDFNSACDVVKMCASECQLGEFNGENDKIIGMIPSFMISKNNKVSNTNTSYIPKNNV